MQYLVRENERDRDRRFFEFDFCRYFGKFLVTHRPEVIAGPPAERAFADRVDRIIEECNAVYNGFVGSFIMLPGIPVECKQPGIVGYVEYTVGCDG